jgi:hypothetical protein
VTKPTLIRNARLIDPANNKFEDGAILFAEKILDVGAVSCAQMAPRPWTPTAHISRLASAAARRRETDIHRR